MRFIIYSLVLVFVLLAGPFLALAGSKPMPGEVMLVIGPGSTARQEMIQETGGRVIGPEMAHFGAFALSEREDFASALLEQGAWFVIDGRQVAFLCGVDV